MARSSMAALITQVRLLVGDPAGASAVFSDDELQTFLDNNATEAFYEALEAEPTIAAGGATTYLTWRHAAGWWEADEVLTDSSYNELTAASADRQRGRWTFAASQSAVLITGTHFDVYMAAAETDVKSPASPPRIKPRCSHSHGDPQERSNVFVLGYKSPPMRHSSTTIGRANIIKNWTL